VLARVLLGAFALAGALLLAGSAPAQQCRNPGQTCGVFGGTCCSGSSCIIGFCVANPPTCQGEGGLCLSTSQCCGSRVCEIGFCRTPVGLGAACGPAAPCVSGLVCDPLAGFRCVDQSADLGDACGPLVHCSAGLVCDPLAGFRCVDQSAELGEACGPLVQCVSGLVCDPLAGLRCVDQSAELGQACGPLVQCTPGLACDPLAGFRCVDASVAAGQPCGPLVQCGAGLFCDPFAGFRCVSAAGVDQPCGPGVPCQAGLQCTLALRCAHDPARAGETCDVTAPCGDGLFCQPGLPQRCQVLRRPGEGCSAVNPCIAGASCEACFVNGCNAPFQCFWNANEGAITEQQCRTLHSPGLQRAAGDTSLTMTYAVGDGIAGLLGESQSFGVAYGQDGRYGCYTTLCGGLNADVSIEAFACVGFATSFDVVGGSSFANFQEAQLPGNVLNFSTSQVFARDGLLPLPELTGTEDCLAVGVGPNILPFSAGSFLCETVLDTVIDPATGDPPAALAVAPPLFRNSGFGFDLAAWTCAGGGACAWVDDDAAGAAASGAGQVTSPPAGSASASGRLVSSCAGVAPGQDTLLSAWVKTSGARPGALSAVWNAGLDCDGAVVRRDALGSSLPDGTWRELSVREHAPLGAQSLRIEASAAREGDAASTTRIDLVRVPEPSGALPGLVALAAALLAARRRGR
jgi:hypothetical protein